VANLIGILYSIVIFLACVLGSIVGLGGGLFVRPIFETIGYHNVLNIAFFSSTAIFTMAAVSTVKKLKDGTKFDPKIAILFSLGAVLGGILGNLFLEHLVQIFRSEAQVQMVQIVLTVLVLILSLILTANKTLRYNIESKWICLVFGVLLGSVYTFLGIGGGVLNVPLLMIFFGLAFKEATAYSIVNILFAHLSRLLTMGLTLGYSYFDLPVLLYVIPAAALGGLIGTRLNKAFSESTVKRMFLATVSAMIALNVVNGILLI